MRAGYDVLDLDVLMEHIPAISLQDLHHARVVTAGNVPREGLLDILEMIGIGVVPALRIEESSAA